nr:H-NS histone family protein [Achromobacter sp. B7]
MRAHDELTKVRAEIRKLKSRLRLIRARGRRSALRTILTLMDANQLSLHDVSVAAGGAADGVEHFRGFVGTPSKLPPKYRQPGTNLTWTGRGLTPRWIVAAETGGAHRSVFLIDNPLQRR